MDNDLVRRPVLTVLIGIVTATCGGGTIGVGTSTTTVAEPSTTTTGTSMTVVGTTSDLRVHCGTVELPFEDPMVLPDEPLDDEVRAILEAASRPAAIEFEQFAGYEWSIAEWSDDVLVLFGRLTGEGFSSYADARLELRDGVWTLSQWGGCHLEVSAPGYGNARWILDPDSEPDPASPTLAIQINEQACASGQAPVGREVLPVVIEEADRVTITVLVANQTTTSTLTCQGNPWFPVVVELDAPWNGRALFDASMIPAEERTWPPDVPVEGRSRPFGSAL